jgi:hypothetical protein
MNAYLETTTQKGNSWNFISQIKKSILTHRNLNVNINMNVFMEMKTE